MIKGFRKMATENERPLIHQTETNQLVQWLEKRGLRRNPFEYTNAEYELSSLPGYFVDTGEFDTLFSIKQPCLIFAKRGCGKTAQRQMLAAQCRPSSSASSILGIHYTYEGFERTFTLAGNSVEKINIGHHVEALLHTGMSVLSEEINRDQEVRLSLQSSDILPDTAAYFLHFDLDASLFKDVDYKSKMYPSTPADQLRGFARLLQKAGFETGMIFIDGVDESMMITSDPEQSVLFLSQMLGTLPLIECPGLAFKFFLSHDLEPALLSQRWYRPDRFYISHITWDMDRIKEMLKQRLTFFSTRKPEYVSLAEFCDSQLAEVINKELIQLSEENPRNTLRLANMLIHEHISKPKPAELISLTSWKIVKEKWIQQYGIHSKQNLSVQTEHLIPDKELDILLRIEEEKGKVWLEGKEIRTKFTPQDYQVLLSLYRHRNEICSKETVINEAWEDSNCMGVSDAALVASIRRIRGVFNQVCVGKEFIETIRGRKRFTGGYRLYTNGFLSEKDKK
jgi:DNA-binding winged helix-turn-helix (wHTH) protein